MYYRSVIWQYAGGGWWEFEHLLRVCLFVSTVGLGSSLHHWSSLLFSCVFSAVGTKCEVWGSLFQGAWLAEAVRVIPLCCHSLRSHCLCLKHTDIIWDREVKAKTAGWRCRNSVPGESRTDVSKAICARCKTLSARSGASPSLRISQADYPCSHSHRRAPKES